jgi:hypothetical protein
VSSGKIDAESIFKDGIYQGGDLFEKLEGIWSLNVKIVKRNSSLMRH